MLGKKNMEDGAPDENPVTKALAGVLPDLWGALMAAVEAGDMAAAKAAREQLNSALDTVIGGDAEPAPEEIAPTPEAIAAGLCDPNKKQMTEAQRHNAELQSQLAAQGAKLTAMEINSFLLVEQTTGFISAAEVAEIGKSKTLAEAQDKVKLLRLSRKEPPFTGKHAFDMSKVKVEGLPTKLAELTTSKAWEGADDSLVEEFLRATDVLAKDAKATEQLITDTREHHRIRLERQELQAVLGGVK